MAQYLPLPDGSSVTVREGETPQQAWARAQQMYPEAFQARQPQVKPEPTVGGQVKEFFKGILPGGIGALESAAVGASALLPEDYEKQARAGIASIAGAAKKPFEAAPGYEDTVARKFGEATGSIAPFLLTGPFGAAGRIAGAGLGMGMGAGEARTRAEQEGATAEQRALATGLGSVVGISEMFAPARILGRVGEPVKAGIAAQLKRIAMAGGEEAAQEAASQAAQNLIAKGIYKPEQEIIEQVGESAAYGGAVGALAQGLLDMALGRRAKGATGAPDEIAQARAEANAQREELMRKRQDPAYAQEIEAKYNDLEQQRLDLESQIKKGKKGEPLSSVDQESNKLIRKQLATLNKELSPVSSEYAKVKATLARAAKDKEAADLVRYADLEAQAAAEVPQEARQIPYGYQPQQALPGFEDVAAPETKAKPEFVDYASQIRNLEGRLDDLRTQAQQTKDLAQKQEINRQYQKVQAAIADAQRLAKEQQKVEAPSNETKIASLRKRMAAAEESGDVPAQASIAQQLLDLGVTELVPAPVPAQTAMPLMPQKSISEGKESFAARVYKPGAPAAEAEEAALLEERRLQDEQDRAEALRAQRVAPEAVALRRIAGRPAGITNVMTAFEQPEPGQPGGSAAMAMMNQRLRLEADLNAARESYAQARKNFDGSQATQQTLNFAEQKLASAQQAYDASLSEMRQQELIPTAEEVVTAPEPEPKLRKAPSEGFRLFARQGAPERPSDYQNLSTRLASALARNDIDQDTYEFLRRAERVMPSIDQQIETERVARTERGVARDVSSTEGFLTLLDRQLDLIERNQEGVYPSRRYVEEAVPTRGTSAEVAPPSEASGRDTKAFRTMEPASYAKMASRKRAQRIGALPGDTERVNLPGVPTTERAEATRGTTLRTPAKPLSLATELEPLLRLQEQLAGPDLAETTQQELFPAEARGVVRATNATFVKFMQSKEVQALRAKLPKKRADVERQLGRLPELRSKVTSLQQKLSEMEKAARDFKTAQQELKSNTDLKYTERNITSVQEAITKNVTDKIGLEKQIQELGADIKKLEDARQKLLAPDIMVRKLKGAATKIGVGKGVTVPYRPRDMETDPVLADQLMSLENATTDLRARMEDLLAERTAIDTALSRLDGYVRVIKARTELARLRREAPRGYEIKQAQDALRAAQIEAGMAEQAVSKAQAESTKEAAQERRRQAAIESARRIDESTQRAKEQQAKLEAMYSQETTGQQVQFDPEVQARQMAAEMAEPEYDATERKELLENPEKVLGGLNSNASKIQRQIKASRNSAIEARKAELKPLQARVDALESAYKLAQDSATRALLLPKIEKATTELQDAVERQATEPLTFVGQKKLMRDLAVALNKVDDIETKIATGRIVPKNAPEREGPKIKPSKGEQAAAKEKANKEQAAEAATRAGAPATSGEALSRTEAKKAGEAKPTVYTGRGVGTEVKNPMKTGKGVAAPIREEGGTPISAESYRQLLDGSIVRAVNDVAENSEVPLLKETANKVKDFILRTKFEFVPEIIHKGKKVAALYDPSNNTVYMTPEGRTQEDLIHEVTHAATMRALTMPDADLTAEQRAAKKELQDMYDLMAKDARFKDQYALEDLKEFVSEVQSNQDLRNLMDEKPGMLRRFFNAVLRFLGVNPTVLDSAKAQAAIEKLYMQSRVIEEAQPVASGRATYVNDEWAAAGQTIDKFVAKNKSWVDKVKANTTGLAFETQLVDRFAGYERLRKYMEEHKGTQMMYYMRMYDQRMNMVSQAVEKGAPQFVEKTRPDGNKEYLIEAKEGPSIKNVVQILRAAQPMVGNGDAVNRAFTMYMAGIRADNKGFDTLNFSEDVTPEMLKETQDLVKATPGLEKVFNEARDEYNAYNRNLVQFVADSGAISQELADTLLEENDYIPFYRERNGVAELVIGSEAPIRIGSTKEQPYLQELLGGDQPILDFMTSSVQNTNMLLDMGLRNMATKNAVFELLDLGAAKFVKKADGPNVVQFKDDGETKYAVLSTEKVRIGNKEFDTGVPADILIKGMEGIPTQMPLLVRAMAVPAQLLRKSVTLSPLYMARQLFRDSLAAPLLSGANFTPVIGALRQIGKPTKDILERRGITGGQQFTGSAQDISKILRDISDGKPGWMEALGKFEAMGMEADALTRRAQYNSYIEQGMSEMEATLMSLESMNFNKRGASPSVHWANALIPFFNAQIQGLNVLYKAMSGKMPFNDKLRIREKLLQRGSMMAVASIAYALAMQDDEAYQNATPDQKYANWFVRLPGMDEPIRVPIPFEIGYIFKALPEALVNTMSTERGGEEALKALRQIVLQSIPGGSNYGIPQALKPAIEAGLGKSFYTGRDILSQREANLLPEEQFRANTTDVAKLLGKLGISPIVFENLVRGYTGTMGIAFLQALSLGVPKGESPEQATRRLSEYPVVGGAWQPNDAGGIANSAYERMNDVKKLENTINKMVEEGRTAEAMALMTKRGNEYMQAELGDSFRSNMQELTRAERAIQASAMTPQQKREQLDEIRKLKTALAKTTLEVADKTIRLSSQP